MEFEVNLSPLLPKKIKFCDESTRVQKLSDQKEPKQMNAKNIEEFSSKDDDSAMVGVEKGNGKKGHLN